MVASVFICQVVAIPSILKTFFKTSRYIVAKLIFHYVSLWNLDFFCLVYTPFCLHPKLNNMQVLALDYLIAVYPMLLIFLTHIAVTLHDRYPLIVTLWRPMQRVLTCIRKEWNIRGSLVQAFATFLVLSIERGDYPTALRNLKHICGCHNFSPLSSVQIIIIPACVVASYKPKL